MKRWLVVELLIAKEIGEAVSNFLIEQGATGIEELDGDLKRERLRAYFRRDERKRRILDVLRRYLKSLKRLFPGHPLPKSGRPLFPSRIGVRTGKGFLNLFR